MCDIMYILAGIWGIGTASFAGLVTYGLIEQFRSK